MAFAALFVLPTQVCPYSSRLKSSLLLYQNKPKRRNRSIVPVARLFGRAIFEASKLKVLFLGVDKEKHPGNLPRTYTLTHSDITSELTLAISHTINRAQLQGWYNRLQRDEVVAEWKKVQGKMSLHVHCHISGGHLFLDFIAKLRHYIFSKELPLVLKAFVHGDGNLFNTYPELEEALVWVYFHSSLEEFNRVECWGPLKDAAEGATEVRKQFFSSSSESTVEGSKEWVMPLRCRIDCTCCFPPMILIPLPRDHSDEPGVAEDNLWAYGDEIAHGVQDPEMDDDEGFLA